MLSLTEAYRGTQSFDKLQLLIFAACFARELLACVSFYWNEGALQDLINFFLTIYQRQI